MKGKKGQSFGLKECSDISHLLQLYSGKLMADSTILYCSTAQSVFHDADSEDLSLSIYDAS